jgi:hypothetical protein
MPTGYSCKAAARCGMAYNGGAKVREVFPPKRGKLQWRKAQASVANGACVEVATAGKVVAIRDSKNPDGHVIFSPREEFGEFLNVAKRGAFDLKK